MRHHRLRSQKRDAEATVRRPKRWCTCGLAILNPARKSASGMTCLALPAGVTPPVWAAAWGVRRRHSPCSLLRHEDYKMPRTCRCTACGGCQYRCRLADVAGARGIARQRLRQRALGVDANPPDFLVTEVRLGEFNGLQLAIRAHVHSPTISTIVIGDDDIVLERDALAQQARYVKTPELARVFSETACAVFR